MIVDKKASVVLMNYKVKNDLPIVFHSICSLSSGPVICFLYIRSLLSGPFHLFMFI